MATNNFKPFATSGGANVETQSAFEADTSVLSNGFSTGIAESIKLNKVWRQSAVITSQLAQIAADSSGLDLLDDGDLTTLRTHLGTGLHLISRAIDTSSTVNVMTASLSTTPVLLDGLAIYLKPAITNTTSCTFNLNGLGAVAVQSNGSALAGGELLAGKYYILVYNSSSSNWDLQGSATTAVTQATPDNSTKIATTAFIKNQQYAPLTSPVLVGVPTAPTATSGDSSNTIASTAFVQDAIVHDTIHLLKAGGTMSGALALAFTPTASLHAVTKAYVDAKVPTKQRIEWNDFIDVGTPSYVGAFFDVKTHSFTTPANCTLVQVSYRTNALHNNSAGHSTEWLLLLNGTAVSSSQSNANGSDNMVFQLPMGFIANVTGGTTYTLKLQAKTYTSAGNVWTNGGQDSSSSSGVQMGKSEIDLLFF